MKMYLLSDNIDTQRGMRLAGVEGVVVHTEGEVSAALESVREHQEIGVLLVTKKLAADFPGLFREMKLTQKTPLLVEIPDRHGAGGFGEAIAEYVREAVGIKI